MKGNALDVKHSNIMKHNETWSENVLQSVASPVGQRGTAAYGTGRGAACQAQLPTFFTSIDGGWWLTSVDRYG